MLLGFFLFLCPPVGTVAPASLLCTVQQGPTTSMGRGRGGVGWAGQGVWPRGEIRGLKATLQQLCCKTYELMMEAADDQKLANGGGGAVPWGGRASPSLR